MSLTDEQEKTLSAAEKWYKLKADCEQAITDLDDAAGEVFNAFMWLEHYFPDMFSDLTGPVMVDVDAVRDVLNRCESEWCDPDEDDDE